MLDKIQTIQNRYDELCKLLEIHAVEYQMVAELAKEKSDLEPVIETATKYRDTARQLDEAKTLLESNDPEMRDLALAEIHELDSNLSDYENQLKILLVPKDPRDDRNVIVEIRAGPGGDEAGLFAADLMRMYIHYAEQKKWHTELLSSSETGIGGYKEVIFTIKGKGTYSRMKYESGVHRVQRVPVTESSGRIHTSTASVIVLAEVDEVDVQIPESDLVIDVFKSSGAGGQSVQKNSTAIRITHMPTGMVVACQDERSQLQNKLRAMSILRARLYDIEIQKRQQELENTRRSQVGSGERSEKIRTYNFPQSRVTDHRINISNFNIAAVMSGDLDPFIDELSLRQETERLSVSSDEQEE